MQTQNLLSQIHLRNLQIIQNNPSARKSNRGPNSNRTLMKLYLTRQILEQCLYTLDIFKQILEDPIQKNKLVRDVNKNLQLKLYDLGGIIYNKGEISNCFYLIIKGKVSLCLPTYKHQDQDHYQTQQEDEIDTFSEGFGFGEAEFIHGRKRGLVAKAKTNDTVVGVIQGLAFQEIIQLYKQRVYYKKTQMFSKCPLLKNLLPHQLQFIVNNAKPMKIPISRQIIKQNDKSKALYLITQGQVQLRRSNQLLEDHKKGIKYQLNNRKKLQDVVKEKIKLKSLVVGVLEEGEFIGDSQIAMDIPYSFSAFAKSQKTRLYMCDQRIIVTQMTEQLFSSAFQYYKNKIKYHQDKPEIYHKAKSQLQIRLNNQDKNMLSQQQMKKKRMILNRYVQNSPTLIGRLSPRQITKIVDKNYSKLRTQPSRNSSKNSHYLPQLSIITPNKKLQPNQRSYSPLLKKSHSKQERKYTQSPYSYKKLEYFTKNQSYQYEVIKQPSQFERSQSRPMLLFMKPFVKKVFSLHERLTQQYNKQKSQDTNISKSIKRQRNDRYSIIQMRRVYEFINKIKSQKGKK